MLTFRQSGRGGVWVISRIEGRVQLILVVVGGFPFAQLTHARPIYCFTYYYKITRCRCFFLVVLAMFLLSLVLLLFIVWLNNEIIYLTTQMCCATRHVARCRFHQHQYVRLSRALTHTEEIQIHVHSHTRTHLHTSAKRVWRWTRSWRMSWPMP